MSYQEAMKWRERTLFHAAADEIVDNGLFDSEIKSVRVKKLSLDLECLSDIINGLGIRLTSVDAYDKKNQKIWNGLQSEFFGTDFGDDRAFEERHSCACKHLIGMSHDGEICPICGTVVEYQDINLKKCGWIILDEFRVFSPIHWAKLVDALGASDGEKVANKIIQVDYEDDGTIKYSDKELIELKKHPFIKKGMNWLVENIYEVLDYYEKKKPTKKKLFQELKEDTGVMFTHSIPVYTAILRTELPGEKGSKLYKMKINTIYQSIIRISNFINGYEKEELTDDRAINSINKQLCAIQMELADVFDIIYKNMTSKAGDLMAKVLGGRVNFSARNIIIPSSGVLRMDEVEVGYQTFMELFRYELINFYSKINQCTIREASNAWKRALIDFDSKFFKIMEYMTTDKKCRKYMGVLISRNPCINYGSYLYMYIRRVKSDIEDKTMTIPSGICVTQNADFDGDVENIYRIFGDYFHKAFSKCLNPRYNLLVSRMTGKLNRDTMPYKDENVGFYLFNNV